MRIETKKVMVYVCMAQVTERGGACQKGEEGVDTLRVVQELIDAKKFYFQLIILIRQLTFNQLSINWQENNYNCN